MANDKLRKMSEFRARELCKLDLQNDPAAKARYQRYDRDEKQVMPTYSANYRAVIKGGYGSNHRDDW